MSKMLGSRSFGTRRDLKKHPDQLPHRIYEKLQSKETQGPSKAKSGPILSHGLIPSWIFQSLSKLWNPHNDPQGHPRCLTHTSPLLQGLTTALRQFSLVSAMCSLKLEYRKGQSHSLVCSSYSAIFLPLALWSFQTEGMLFTEPTPT